MENGWVVNTSVSKNSIDITSEKDKYTWFNEIEKNWIKIMYFVNLCDRKYIIKDMNCCDMIFCLKNVINDFCLEFNRIKSEFKMNVSLSCMLDYIFMN